MSYIFNIADIVAARGCGKTSRQLDVFISELDALLEKAEDMILDTFVNFGFSKNWLYENRDRVRMDIITYGAEKNYRFSVDGLVLFALVTIRDGLGLKMFICKHQEYPRGVYECETK